MVGHGHNFFKEARFAYCLAFYSNYGAYYCSKSKPIVYPNVVRCNFSLCLGVLPPITQLISS